MRRLLTLTFVALCLILLAVASAQASDFCLYCTLGDCEVSGTLHCQSVQVFLPIVMNGG